MKKIITKQSIVIASIAMILALISIISVSAFNTQGPVTGFAHTVTRPIRALTSTVAGIFEDIFASIYRYDQLERRFEELAAQHANLVRAQHIAAELADENERLRAALGFRALRPDVEQEMATLVSWSSDNWSHAFTINRGYANSDVRSGMGVATEYGVLIGQVTDVRATESTVITILDTTFSVAAFVGELGAGGAAISATDGVSATATGDFNFMRNGLLILDFIDEDTTLLRSAPVITTGAGGVFPPGLIVGEIEAVFPHANGIGRFATIRPIRTLDTISTVFVITEFENPD